MEIWQKKINERITLYKIDRETYKSAVMQFLFFYVTKAILKGDVKQ